jgi:hypothetical protein
MKTIPLTKGYSAIVDEEDYERVAAHKWCAAVEHRADGSERVYVQRSARKHGRGQVTEKLHRFIINAPDGLQVDHINGNPLDNRRENMRLCTTSENTRNQRAGMGGISAFKGVCYHKASAKWLAYIKVNAKQKHLGQFADETDAARAYDAAAIKHFGEFARINFPGGACQ